jgi:hypothetical protein
VESLADIHSVDAFAIGAIYWTACIDIGGNDSVIDQENIAGNRQLVRLEIDGAKIGICVDGPRTILEQVTSDIP